MFLTNITYYKFSYFKYLCFQIIREGGVLNVLNTISKNAYKYSLLYLEVMRYLSKENKHMGFVSRVYTYLKPKFTNSTDFNSYPANICWSSCLEDVFKTCLQDVFKTCLQDVFKTFTGNVLLGISASKKS